MIDPVTALATASTAFNLIKKGLPQVEILKQWVQILVDGWELYRILKNVKSILKTTFI